MPRQKPLEQIDDYLPWLRAQLGREADYFEHGVNCNSIVARPWDKEEYLHPTNFVISQSASIFCGGATRQALLPLSLLPSPAPAL